MKLRNKKTGEIVEYISFKTDNSQICLYVFDTAKHYYYNSLSELNAEWGDYEEPKGFFEIEWSGDVCKTDVEGYDHAILGAKSIGNHFETKEAEKAVEKLKAFTRLKDGGFRFNGYTHYDWNGNESPAIAFEYSDFDKMFDDAQVVADLDICFGGEE